MKRPNRAEKISQQTNQPIYATPLRGNSPEPTTKSSIPLFNTSRKGSNTIPLNKGISEGDMEDREMAQMDSIKTGVGKKKSLKEKVKIATEGIEKRGKLVDGKIGKKSGGILGGVDYLKLHEKKVGGLKRKIR